MSAWKDAAARRLLDHYPGLWEAIEEPRLGGVTTWEVYDGSGELVAITMSEAKAQMLCDLREWLAGAVSALERLRAQNSEGTR